MAPFVATTSDGTILHVALSLVLQVDIEVRPGDSNSVNPRGGGVLPAAILTTATFDAAVVDAASVRFDATGSELWPWPART